MCNPSALVLTLKYSHVGYVPGDLKASVGLGPDGHQSDPPVGPGWGLSRPSFPLARRVECQGPKSATSIPAHLMLSESWVLPVPLTLLLPVRSP